MQKVLQLQRLILRSKRLPWVVIGLALVILAGTLLLASYQLRQKIRTQIASRDAEVLHAVALMLQYEAAGEEEGLSDADDPFTQSAVLLKTSRLGGVLAARLFDSAGRFVEAFPPDVAEATLEHRCLPPLTLLKPVSRFHASARLSEVFDGGESETPVPLLEVNVPLAATPPRLVGIAQFILDGEPIAAEYARLDRHIALQALAAFLVGGGGLVLSITWAFRRLHRANRLLAERSRDLLLANQELALAARTSAVGAVTSHLIHGLRSPLSGLQSFVTGAGQADRMAADWQQAIASTRRMQTLINQVVSVLREEEGGRHYEVTLEELAAIVSDRVRALASDRGVQFHARPSGHAPLPNRAANLLALILGNLCQNGIEATPPGNTVTLSLGTGEGKLICEVADEGPGFPETLLTSLFTPCQSSKEGGSGIGLAICKQLANHLGASLELKRNTPSGCVFALTLPLAPCPKPVQTTTVTLSG